MRRLPRTRMEASGTERSDAAGELSGAHANTTHAHRVTAKSRLAVPAVRTRSVVQRLRIPDNVQPDLRGQSVKISGGRLGIVGAVDSLSRLRGRVGEGARAARAELWKMPLPRKLWCAGVGNDGGSTSVEKPPPCPSPASGGGD